MGEVGSLAPLAPHDDTICQDDALATLRRLPDRSIQCAVTSPPC